MTKKVRNLEYYRAMVELRRSNAARKHKNKYREHKKGRGKGGRPKKYDDD